MGGGSGSIHQGCTAKGINLIIGHPEKNLDFLAYADESVQKTVYLQCHPGFSLKGEGSKRQELPQGPSYIRSGEHFHGLLQLPF